MVCDQYGRQIRRCVREDGRELLFADKPPEANRENEVTARPQFATHEEVLASLAEEGIDWLAYEVRFIRKQGGESKRDKLTLSRATQVQAQLIREGHGHVTIMRHIACAGWPQLPYAKLRALPPGALPPVPSDVVAQNARLAELRKIPNRQLRADAIKMWREMVAEASADPESPAEGE